MIVKRLERMVTDALAHEEHTRSLECAVRGVMLSRYGSGARSAERIEERTDAVMTYLRLYVQSAPALLGATWNAATEDGFSVEFEPIGTAVEDSILRATDLLPAHLGLIGMTDDAYMVQSLMQWMSEGRGRGDGAAGPLISIDLADANAMMRRMIGEPLATTLDATVRRILGLREVQEAREELDRRGARLRLKVLDPYAGKVPSGDDLDLHLGVLGGKG